MLKSIYEFRLSIYARFTLLTEKVQGFTKVWYPSSCPHLMVKLSTIIWYLDWTMISDLVEPCFQIWLNHDFRFGWTMVSDLVEPWIWIMLNDDFRFGWTMISDLVEPWIWIMLNDDFRFCWTMVSYSLNHETGLYWTKISNYVQPSFLILWTMNLYFFEPLFKVLQIHSLVSNWTLYNTVIHAKSINQPHDYIKLLFLGW